MAQDTDPLKLRDENNVLLQDIADLCRRSDRRGPEKILLLGKVGAGKSALINTIGKALTGQYIQKAKLGAGVTQSKTLCLERYPFCGVTHDDFVNKSNWDILQGSLANLPTIIDAPGVMDIGSELQQEILELLIGGYIPNGTSIESLEAFWKSEYPGALKDMYNKPDPENRVSKIIYVHSCQEIVPKKFVDCLQKVIKLTNETTQQLLYMGGVFVVITKCDLVQDLFKYEVSTPVENKMSMTEFKDVESEVAAYLNIEGALDFNRICWISYTDKIKLDNPQIDNIALKFLKCMLQPGGPKIEVVEPVLTMEKKLKVKLKKWINDNYDSNAISCKNVFIVCVLSVILAFIFTLLGMTPK